MNQDLKPCPSCGSDDVTSDSWMGHTALEARVACERCGLRMEGYSEAEAIERWNAQPMIDALCAENARIKDDRAAMLVTLRRVVNGGVRAGTPGSGWLAEQMQAIVAPVLQERDEAQAQIEIINRDREVLQGTVARLETELARLDGCTPVKFTVTEGKPHSMPIGPVEFDPENWHEEIDGPIGAPCWISVSERLPDMTDGYRSDEVLVLDACNNIRNGYYHHLHKHWASCSFSQIREATHWQPLPLPPAPTLPNAR